MAQQSAREGYRHWDMVMLGWKYNMSNVEAALLLPQFDRMNAKLASRHALAQRYEEGFSGMDGITLPFYPGMRLDEVDIVVESVGFCVKNVPVARARGA